MDKWAKFLKARLDEDEFIANFLKRAAFYAEQNHLADELAMSSVSFMSSVAETPELREDFLKFAELSDRGYKFMNDADRVLTDIAAKRKILDLYEEYVSRDTGLHDGWGYGRDALEEVIRFHCEPFAQHPDYPGER